MSMHRSSSFRRPARRTLAACLTLALIAPAAFAAPAVVNCDDSGTGSLRAAVAAAATGDVIDLSGLSCQAITLASAITSGVADLTVRAGTTQGFAIGGNDTARLFTHMGASRLTLENLALAHGRAADIGGCVMSSANLTLNNVTLDACTAGGNDVPGARGGAVSAEGDVTLVTVRITNSRADGTGRVFGGGVFAAGALDGTDVVASGNTAQSHLSSGSPFDNIVQGGGLHSHADMVLRASTISGNTALSDSYESFGGGISAGSREQGSPLTTLTLLDSAITGNTNESHCDVCAPQGGGGIVVGDASFSHVTLSDNVVKSTNHYGGGGGFRFFDGSTADIVDSVISGNHADSAGGGMIGPGQGTLTIRRTQVRDNVAGNDGGTNEGGGGVLGFGVAVKLVDSSVTGNTAGADGGGVNLLFGEYAPSPSTFVNSTISGNTAREGGGIMSDGAVVQVSNSTVAFNTATRRGAGISGSEYTYQISLASSIISNNAVAGAPADVWAFPDVVSGAKNIIPGGGGPAGVPSDTITTDPLLLPLADNGGATLTHAFDASSPALDSGDNPLGLMHDQRAGYWQRVAGGTADIGAYEAQETPDTLFANGFETTTD